VGYPEAISVNLDFVLLKRLIKNYARSSRKRAISLLLNDLIGYEWQYITSQSQQVELKARESETINLRRQVKAGGCMNYCERFACSRTMCESDKETCFYTIML
jgi:hypothetical protein